MLEKGTAKLRNDAQINVTEDTLGTTCQQPRYFGILMLVICDA